MRYVSYMYDYGSFNHTASRICDAFVKLLLLCGTLLSFCCRVFVLSFDIRRIAICIIFTS